MGNSEWEVVVAAVDRGRREDMERQVLGVKSKFRTARAVLTRAKSQWKTADEVPAKIKQIEKSLDQKEDAAICETIDGLNIHYRGVYCEMFGGDPEIPDEVLQGLMELTMTASELPGNGSVLTEKDLDVVLLAAKPAPVDPADVDDEEGGDAPDSAQAAPAAGGKAPAPAAKSNVVALPVGGKAASAPVVDSAKPKIGRKKSELTVNEKKLVLDLIDSAGAQGISFPSAREKADLTESYQGRALRNWIEELCGCKALAAKGERRSRVYLKGANFDSIRETVKAACDK